MTNISLRVTEELKEKLIKKAKKKNLSLSAYITNILQDENIPNKSTIDSNNEKYILDILKKELQEKNKLIDNLTKLLDQQQQLTLNNQNIFNVNESQKRLSNTESSKSWWKFWSK